jgi:uncharacterized phage protein gp47/JayE
MAGLTSGGLVIKTLPEIRTALENKLKARYGSTFSVDTNTPEGVIIGVFADELSDAWEGLQGTYDAAFPKSSYGLNLDNVADIVNITRIPASKSAALLQVTGAVGSTLVEDSVVTVTDTNERFIATNTLTLVGTQFSDVTLEVTAVANTTAYEITINNILVSITSDASATAAEIVGSLKAAIDLLALGVTTTLPTSSTLRINVTEPSSVYPLLVGARLGITSISDLVTVEAINQGVVKAPAGTLVTLLVPAVGITSVTNLEGAAEGREQETDEELRVRRYESVQIIGASTEQAIVANVKNLTGVTAAFIIANRTYTTDGEGRPPKSFEVVVEGGDEQEVAETIWRYHPVGIETFGDITRTIVDDNGINQSVKFSRPINILIRMEIDYTKYDEEAFSASGEDGIKQAALAYGQTLNIGVDVIPQRFFGNIFGSVQGISSLVVRLSKSTDGITWSSYSTAPVDIMRKERSSFDITRIYPNEV